MPPTKKMTAFSHVQEIHTTTNAIKIVDIKREMIYDLLEAWVSADIQSIYKQIEKLRDEFVGKPVAIIIDEVTDSCARSVVNVLFSYNGKSKLVLVEFLQEINNTNIGQLVLRIFYSFNFSMAYNI
ncbi:39383_t:CDS:2 [Gigaspora margarita]|uniref:39383_t:CDS:1 n=1 Tax=Gigaspora margarita TaxID=4874 RepID=A0ABM8VX94_GIGMA|nr:39383_t:CDS:2 [Gigaspora margarita]